MSIPEAARVVDLERYPIHQLDSPQGAALVAGWRRELDRTGACNLQDFLTPAGARELAAEAEAMLPQAYERTFTVNFRYRDQVDPDLPASHPERRFWTATSLNLARSIGRTNALFGKSIESPQVVDQAVNCHFEVVSAVIGRSSGLAGRENSHTSAQVATSPATGTTVTAPRRWDSQPRSGTRWISRTSSSGAAPGTAASAR